MLFLMFYFIFTNNLFSNYRFWVGSFNAYDIITKIRIVAILDSDEFQIEFRTERVGMFMIFPFTRYHMPTSLQS